jgi:hypothetical protein
MSFVKSARPMFGARRLRVSVGDPGSLAVFIFRKGYYPRLWRMYLRLAAGAVWSEIRLWRLLLFSRWAWFGR